MESSGVLRNIFRVTGIWLWERRRPFAVTRTLTSWLGTHVIILYRTVTAPANFGNGNALKQLEGPEARVLTRIPSSNV